MNDYYERQPARHDDGTLLFATAADSAAEAEVAAALEAAWNCKLLPFGKLAPIDWFAQRHERLIGVVELKARKHSTTDFPTVWLNLRKWLALSLASHGMGVPAVFVVRFADALRWIDVRCVDARRVRIGGCGKPRAIPTASAVEPVIEVPVADMKPLHTLMGEAA